MSGPLLLGIDVGGTRTKIAVVADDAARDEGALLAVDVGPTPARDRAGFIADVVTRCHAAVSAAGGSWPAVAAVGVGLPGFVADDEVSQLWPSLSFLAGSGLAAELGTALQRDVRLDNDARVVALGEQRYGAHPSARRLLSLTIGTGLGIALVVDGALQEHTSLTHLAGHIPIRADGPPCFCGFSGCLEVCVSGPHLAALAADGGYHDTAALLGGSGAATRQWRADLTAGLNALIHVYAPDLIVLGGGVGSNLPAAVLPNLAAGLFARPHASYQVQLRASVLGERAGVLGAAALVESPPAQ